MPLVRAQQTGSGCGRAVLMPRLRRACSSAWNLKFVAGYSYAPATNAGRLPMLLTRFVRVVQNSNLVLEHVHSGRKQYAPRHEQHREQERTSGRSCCARLRWRGIIALNRLPWNRYGTCAEQKSSSERCGLPSMRRRFIALDRTRRRQTRTRAVLAAVLAPRQSVDARSYLAEQYRFNLELFCQLNKRAGERCTKRTLELRLDPAPPASRCAEQHDGCWRGDAATRLQHW